MSYFKKIFLSLLIMSGFSANPLFAGNPDRVGQAGAMELLINPWARSSGWAGANTAGIAGGEAMRFNVAGILGVNKTELNFARTTWLSGTDIYINSFSFTQKVGSEGNGALSVSLMSMDVGDIQRTTFEAPDGTLGTYSPTMVNIGVGYARKFSDQIRGGVAMRVINQAIPDASATGVAIDAGIQYHTDLVQGSDLQRTKLGVSLRNVGTPMRFEGDGLDGRGRFEDNDVDRTLRSRSAEFDLPSLLHIGVSQDFYLDDALMHKLTVAATFTSNSYTRDNFLFGLQWSGFDELIMLRGGLYYEDDIFSEEDRAVVFTGPAAGATVNIPFGKEDKHGNKKRFAFDYAFRSTNPFSGVHVIGARVSL